MNNAHDAVMTVDECIQVLDDVAARGFLSEEVKSNYSDRMVQRVTFTEEERKAIKQFCAENVSVLRGIDYPMGSFFFGGEEERTISLLGMMLHMLDGDCGPEYVASNAERLSKARDKFCVISVRDLEKLM